MINLANRMSDDSNLAAGLISGASAENNKVELLIDMQKSFAALEKEIRV